MSADTPSWVGLLRPEANAVEVSSQRLLHDVLRIMRAHLGMEVAFISRVFEGRRIFEYVDADPAFSPVTPGAADDMDDTYCVRVLDGRVPGLVVDAGREPLLAALQVTQLWPIGSHLSVPVQTEDGDTYGTLCCFGRDVLPHLDDRDLGTLRMFADIVSQHVAPLVALQHTTAMARERISRILDDGSLRMALQPVVDLGTSSVDGYEALARFPGDSGWTPDRWFLAAEEAGMGVALESAAVHAALTLLPRIPSRCTLAINVSASALLSSSSIPAMLAGADAPRLILELTEHAPIGDPEHLRWVLTRMRRTGVRVAVDDAGSGYAGLERILSLHPEVLKLDRSLVQDVARDPARQAMCEAMVGFTERTGSGLVAEGVETEEDADMLRAIGVSHVQGYYFGRPEIWAGSGQSSGPAER